MVQISFESGRKYWASRSSVLSFTHAAHSFICSACLACALHCAHSFAGSLTLELVEKRIIDFSKSGCSEPQCAVSLTPPPGCVVGAMSWRYWRGDLHPNYLPPALLHRRGDFTPQFWNRCLAKPAAEWEWSFRKLVNGFTPLNDAAERAVKFGSDFNSVIPHDR